MKSCLSFTVQLTLKKPTVKGLEDDDLSAPAEEPTGLDYSQPWHDDYVANKRQIKRSLHILHPSMPATLKVCQEVLRDILVVDCSSFRLV